MRRWIAFGTAAVAAVAATSLVATALPASAATTRAHATMRDADGDKLGYVTFRTVGNHVLVKADFTKNSKITKGTFHGFHIHANDVDATGKGCKANAADPSTTWFVSADGHYKDGTQKHGAHDGDLPSVLVRDNGKAHLEFDTDRITVKKVVGKAVILHAGPDNFGNVPVGGGAEQYTPGAGAEAKTAATGNAGDRVACGVVKKD